MMCCNICILLCPIKLCHKVHWTVNTVCPFGGIISKHVTRSPGCYLMYNLSPNAMCWRIKGSSVHCSCETPLSRTLPPLLWKKKKKKCKNSFIRLFASPLLLRVSCPWLQDNHKTFTAKPWRIHMSIWCVRPPRSQSLWGSIRISEGDTCCQLMNRDAEGVSGSLYLGLDNLWWWPGGVCYLNSLELLWIICW